MTEQKDVFPTEPSKHGVRPLQIEDRHEYRRTCSGRLPARYVVVILGFFGFFNIYAMRVNLSVAMVAMVYPTAKSANATEACPSLIKDYNTPVYSGMKGERYNWDASTQATILGAFFYGYVVVQVLSGPVVERFGGKWFFGLGIAVTAVFTLLTPLAAELGSKAFIAVRVLEGILEGVTYPAMNLLLSKWSPKYERSILTTIAYTGTIIGNVVAMPVSGMLSGSEALGGWPSVFYFFGALSCLWFIFWMIFIYENPDQHPTISKEELALIMTDNDQSYSSRPPRPWKAILTSVPVWALTAANFGHHWGFLTLLTELPTYLSNMLHFSIEANGFLSALPYLLQALTAWAVGVIADKIRESGRFTINTIRKTANIIGLVGPAICLLIITFAGCRPTLIVGLLCLAMAVNGFIYSGFHVAPIDMSPAFSGTLMGIANGLANLCGFLGTGVVGYFTSSGQTIENWNYIFYISAGVYVLTALIYQFFGTSELQPWGIVQQSEVLNETEKETEFTRNDTLRANGRAA